MPRHHKLIVNHTTGTSSLLATVFTFVYPACKELNKPAELRINAYRYDCTTGDLIQYDGHFYFIKRVLPIIEAIEIPPLEAIDYIEGLRDCRSQ